jgi:hypothetical protein
MSVRSLHGHAVDQDRFNPTELKESKMIEKEQQQLDEKLEEIIIHLHDIAREINDHMIARKIRLAADDLSVIANLRKKQGA